MAFFPQRAGYGRLGVKRFLILCVLVPATLLAWAIHKLAFLLDELLFPGYRKVTVREPVFIVGTPRGGTTFLHRIMAKDTETFTTFQFWELLLAPSIIERKFWLALGRVDRAVGGWGRKAAVRLDAWLLKDFRKIHHLSLFEPEEDEWLFMHILSSVFLLFLFPYPDAFMHLIHFDEQMPAEDRRRMMAFHKRCVQRHLYVHGPEKRLLSKNPTFSAKVDSVNETYPDAKVICCVRTPYSAVPSLASLLTFLISQFNDARVMDSLHDVILETAGHLYRHPMERLPHWPEARHAFVIYDGLTGAPKACVEGLYRRLGFTLSPGYIETLAAEQKRARAYKSTHTYSLEEYGLTQEDIVENFHDVFTQYGFALERPV